MKLTTIWADVKCFILARLEPKEGGGTDKIPTNAETGLNSNAQEPSTWLTGSEAEFYASQWNVLKQAPVIEYGVGMMIADGRFCIDLDHCRNGDSWMPHALAFIERFPGAAVEVSASMEGLHIFGTSRDVPIHGTRNKTYRMECYSKERFIYLTGFGAYGDPRTDCTDALKRFTADFFPAHSQGSASWTSGPVEAWRGPADDNELIERAKRSQSGKSFMGQTASFKDFWEGNADLLSRVYQGDDSAADLAFFNHLAFWTGKDCERMVRLAKLSGMVRDKWQRPDYIERTVLRAVADQTAVYFDSRIASAVGADVPPGTPSQVDPYQTLVDRTDEGNANLLIQLAGGNLRYIAETKQWMRWTGKRWEVDEHEVFVTGFALEVAKHYMQEAQRLRDASRIDLAETAFAWAVKCRNKSSIDNMITLTRKSEGVPISVTELDRKAHLLGVENGVVDLRTGELREDEAREDFVTKRCRVRYIPHARAPRWEALIEQATGSPIPAERDANGNVIAGTIGRYTPRPAVGSYMKKALGYCITGYTREQKFFVAIGDGSNGKGLIFDTSKTLLGPYAVTLPSDALMATKNGADSERPTALVAKLAGARLVVASESKEGQKLDTALIKMHTGDKEMTARRMRENPFTFAITHKLWLLTNAQPAIEHLDAAMKGRLHLVPFDRRWNRPGESDRDPALPDGDADLMTQLASESEGILAWLVQGAVMYEAERLNPPAEVTKRTQEYVREQDHLGRWLSTLQRCPPKQGMLATDLFHQFVQWCGTQSCIPSPNSQNAFSRQLNSRGFAVIHDAQGNRWGLRFDSPIPPTDAYTLHVASSVALASVPTPPVNVPPPPDA